MLDMKDALPDPRTLRQVQRLMRDCFCLGNCEIYASTIGA
jgi:hypothetical protein